MLQNDSGHSINIILASGHKTDNHILRVSSFLAAPCTFDFFLVPVRERTLTELLPVKLGPQSELFATGYC